MVSDWSRAMPDRNLYPCCCSHSPWALLTGLRRLGRALLVAMLLVIDPDDEVDLALNEPRRDLDLLAADSLSRSNASAVRTDSLTCLNGATFSLLLSSRLLKGSTSTLHPPSLDVQGVNSSSEGSESSSPVTASDLREPEEVPRHICVEEDAEDEVEGAQEELPEDDL